MSHGQVTGNIEFKRTSLSLQIKSINPIHGEKKGLMKPIRTSRNMRRKTLGEAPPSKFLTLAAH
jgi:hypothetical protein